MADFAIVPLPDQATKIRFKEPYGSEGLNLKVAGIIPKGIYRGYIPAPQTGYILRLDPDPVAGDHVGVVETLKNYNLTVRGIGAINIDMTGQSVFPVFVVLRVYYEISAGPPLGGMTKAEIRVVRTSVDNSDPGKLHDDDVKICKVHGFVGTTPDISVIIPSDREDNGGPLLTGTSAGVLRAARFEWMIPPPPLSVGSFGTGPLGFVPKLALVASIGREASCFSYILGAADWYSIQDVHSFNTDYSSWLDRYSGSGPPYYPDHPISVYREGHISAYADVAAFGLSGITFNYTITYWAPGDAYWRVQSVVLG